jgi:hypothetical protein
MTATDEMVNIKLLKKDFEYMQEDIRTLKKLILQVEANKLDIANLKRVTYGAVALVLSTVVIGVLSLVIIQ